MKRYWAMKTYLEWWDTFQGEEIIGNDLNLVAFLTVNKLQVENVTL